MQELNLFVFHLFSELTSYKIIEQISPILADLPIFFLPLFLTGMWLYYNFFQKDTTKKEGLLFLFYSSVLALIFSLIIKQFIYFERPLAAVSNSGKLLLEHIPDASFPSDHASASVAFLTGLYLLGYKKVFFAFLPWLILMLLSRIIVGVHWPLDILVGTMIGILGGYIAIIYLPKIKFVKNMNSFIIQILSYIKL